MKDELEKEMAKDLKERKALEKTYSHGHESTKQCALDIVGMMIVVIEATIPFVILLFLMAIFPL